MKKSMLFIALSVVLFAIPSVNAQPIIADFQVNDNEGGYISQRNPKVIPVGNNFLIVFVDTRGVFAQLFDSDRNALTDNFHLEGAWWSNLAYESFASAVSDSGNIIVIWRAGSSFTDIMAHLFDSEGTPIGESFKVSSYIGTSTERSPAVAHGDSGKFIITWDDGRSDGRGDIYARIFDKDGIPLGEEFRVNDDSEAISTGQQTPDIVANSSGDFIIAWEDRRIDFNWEDIFFQHYDNQGNKIGSNRKVNDEGNNSTIAQSDPVVALNDSGYFVITWCDSRENSSNVWDLDIFAQRYDPEENKLGDNFKVNDNPDTLQMRGPAVSINSEGDFVISWADERNGNSDIYTQYYQRGGIPSGDNAKINDDDGDDSQANPFIAANQNGDFYLAWGDYRSIDLSNYIHLQKIAGDGSLIGDNFRTSNLLPLRTVQDYPRIAVNNNGNFMIAWNDQRNGTSDIYARNYSVAGTPVNINFRVNDVLSEANQSTVPAMAVNDNGIYMLTWASQRNNNDDIYAQLYTSNGIAIGSNFKVNDDTTDTQQTRNVVASNNNDFIIVWSDNRNDENDICARRFNESGTALGLSFKVNYSGHSGFTPTVAANDSGKILVVFTEYIEGSQWVITGQLFTSEGVAIDSNFTIFDNPEGVSLLDIYLATFEGGKFVITWLDYTNKDIYAQFISSKGTLIGNHFMVGPDKYSIWNCSMASDGAENSIVVWPDYRNQVHSDNQDEIYAQRFNSDGDTIGSEFKVSTWNNLPQEFYPHIALHNNRIYTTWRDRDRPGMNTGDDIWANVLDWDNPVSFITDLYPVTPEEFTLSQNYPNPFNPTTAIGYRLSAVSIVDLSIYNLLGQKVTTLISERQEIGSHKVEWDASDFASGVYYYRIEVVDPVGRTGRFVDVKKMVLLK